MNPQKKNTLSVINQFFKFISGYLITLAQVEKLNAT